MTRGGWGRKKMRNMWGYILRFDWDEVSEWDVMERKDTKRREVFLPSNKSPSWWWFLLFLGGDSHTLCRMFSLTTSRNTHFRSSCFNQISGCSNSFTRFWMNQQKWGKEANQASGWKVLSQLPMNNYKKRLSRKDREHDWTWMKRSMQPFWKEGHFPTHSKLIPKKDFVRRKKKGLEADGWHDQ